MTGALTSRNPNRLDDAYQVATQLVTVPDAARCLTTSNQRIDGETETFIATAFHNTQDPISSSEYAPAMGRGNQEGCAAHTAQGVRRLTPTECERLQGFPDGWTSLPGAPDSRRYAAMGDAVTVPVARWIGERLARYADE